MLNGHVQMSTYTSVLVPEGTPFRVYRRRNEDLVTVILGADEGVTLEIEDEMVPRLAEAMNAVPPREKDDDEDE